MRGVILGIVAALLMGAPITAQAPTPTPGPEESLSPELVEQVGNQISSAVREFGSQTVIIILILLIVLAVVYYIFRPQSVTMVEQARNTAQARREQTESNRELLTYLRSSDTVIDRNSDAQEKVADAINKSTEVHQAGFVAIVAKIDESSTALQIHFDEVEDAGVNEVNDNTNQQIADLRTEMRAGFERLFIELSGLKIVAPEQARRIDQIVETAKQLEHTTKTDTGELPKVVQSDST